MDTTKTFMEANIPIEKLDHPSIRCWMDKYVKGGGDLPRAETIRSVWIPEVNQSQEDNIKDNVKNQQVAILCDETTDRKGQCVFVILLKTLRADSKQSLFVGAVKVLQNASATECLRALVDTITKYEIPYENVVCVVTDGARYMAKCYNIINDTLTTTRPASVASEQDACNVNQEEKELIE
uniref:DUF659 domain-containing protein n=1 Tax=Timema monikensis TaxID=170555 RepID=A0A7R9HQU4_9NEOP|nr:unnamed protein product [Timema monikensis]